MVFLSTSQVAAMLGCSSRTVSRMCEAGELPASRLSDDDGAKWRIEPGAVRRYAAGRGIPIRETHLVIAAMLTDPDMGLALEAMIEPTPWAIVIACDLFEFGLIARNLSPALLVVAADHHHDPLASVVRRHVYMMHDIRTPRVIAFSDRLTTAQRQRIERGNRMVRMVASPDLAATLLESMEG